MKLAAAVFLATMNAVACGRSRPVPLLESDAAVDGAPRVDASVEARGDGGDVAGEREAGGDGDAADAEPEGPLLRPALPAVDCAPYAGVAGCVLHVRTDGKADASGLGWDTALSDVQDALDRATCGCAVWIAAGTYLPTRTPDTADPDPRNRSFFLWPGLAVFGGFASGEASVTERPAMGSETILSGDLGVPGTRGDNAYHVVVGAEGAVLDGLTVRDGEANGFLNGQVVGGGLFNFGASVTLRGVSVTDNNAATGAGMWNDELSSPTLIGCTLARNVADVGGGLYTSGPRATVERTAFVENVAIFVGGGIAHQGAALTVRDATFLRNRGDWGGALSVTDGETRVERGWFEGNTSGLFGGVVIARNDAKARFESSVLVANGSVGHAGAVAAWTATVELAGATIVGNRSTFGGALLAKDGGHIVLADSVVWRNSDDDGKTFSLDGNGNEVDIATSDAPAEVPAVASFDLDPRLGNVPLDTRWTEAKGTTSSLSVATADKYFAVGDRVELADDGIDRHVTAVSTRSIDIAPPLAAASPRFMRIDHWSASAANLTLDLIPAAGSPLIDAASANAPSLDVTGKARVGAPDIGALERR